MVSQWEVPGCPGISPREAALRPENALVQFPPTGTRAGLWLLRLTRGFDGGLQPGERGLKSGLYHSASGHGSSYATTMWTCEDFPRAQTVARHIAMYDGMYILACYHVYVYRFRLRTFCLHLQKSFST